MCLTGGKLKLCKASEIATSQGKPLAVEGLEDDH